MTMTTSLRQSAARGFTLIELLIVVIIVAILAAIAIPQFSGSTVDAQEATMDANLSTMRTAIELYRVQHNNTFPAVNPSVGGAACTQTPGTGAANAAATFTEQLTNFSDAQGHTCAAGGGTYLFGPYLRAIPAEPISNPSSNIVAMINTQAAPPAPAAGSNGWRYNTATGRFELNNSGNDRRGLPYLNH